MSYDPQREKKTGEMYVYENTTPVSIDTQNEWHFGFNFTAGCLNGFTFDAGKTAAISAFADYSGTVAGTIKATSNTHGLSTGDIISITGTSAPNDYNGVYEITVIDSNEFYFTNAGWNATTTGTFIKGSSLTAGADAEGEYLVSVSGAMTPETNGEAFDFKVYKNATSQDNMETRLKLKNATEFSNFGLTGFITIAEGDIITGAVKNLDGTGDVTIRYSNVNLHRL